MPAKEVKPIRVINHGNVRYRIFVPRILTGGKRKPKFYKTESKALEISKALNLEVAAKFNGLSSYSLEDRVTISKAIQKAGSVETLMKAVDFYSLHNPKEFKTISQLCKVCVAGKKNAGLSNKYLSTFKNTLRRFEDVFKSRQAHEITAIEIEDWLNGGSWQPITRQQYLTDIRTLFSFALKHKYVSFNPASDVEWPKVSRKPPGIFTPEQFMELFDAVLKHDPDLIPVLSLVVFNGLRPDSEASKVEWLFIRGGYVDLPADKTKNNERRLVKLTDTATAWLSLKGQLPPVNWQERLRTVRRKTKLPWPHDVLRHSFCSYAVPIYGVEKSALMADNSEKVLREHYLVRVTKEDAEKFWNIRPNPDKGAHK